MAPSKRHHLVERQHLPLVFWTGRGAIWPRTKVHVAVFSAYAFAVWVLFQMNLSPNIGSGAGSLTAILSMVTGLMVSFRSGSSNDRWSEGRKIWASLQASSRTLQRTLVCGLPARGENKEPLEDSVDEFLALVVAYAYALKHHLRDETDVNHRDLKDLLPTSFIKSLNSTPLASRRFSPSSSDSDMPASPSPRARAPLKRSSTPEAIRGQRLANIDSTQSLLERSVPGAHAPLNLPLAILKSLHEYLNTFHTAPYPINSTTGTVALETVTWANCLGLLKEMTEQLSAAERIRDTPIPLALGIHLQQMLVLYIATIPPQLVEKLGLWVVPVTALATFTFFGVDMISEELSDPFGVEPNDLPLDRFCSDLRREWVELVGESDGSASGVYDWEPVVKTEEGSRLKVQ